MVEKIKNLLTLQIDPTESEDLYHDLIHAIFGVFKKHDNVKKAINRCNQMENRITASKFGANTKTEEVKGPVVQAPAPLSTEQNVKSKQEVACTGFYTDKEVQGGGGKAKRVFKEDQYARAISVINEIALQKGLSRVEFAYEFCMRMGMCISGQVFKKICSHIKYEFNEDRRKNTNEELADCATLVCSGMAIDFARVITKAPVTGVGQLEKVPSSLITDKRLATFYCEHKEVLDDYIKNHPGKLNIPEEVLGTEKLIKSAVQNIAPVDVPVPEETKEVSNEKKPLVRYNDSYLNRHTIENLCDRYNEVLRETSFLGDKAVAVAAKKAGFKMSRENAKKLIFGHKFINKNFEPIETPVYQGLRDTTDPTILRYVTKIKWLRNHGFSIKKISNLVGESIEHVERIYYEIIYTQIYCPQHGDEETWSLKYLNK